MCYLVNWLNFERRVGQIVKLDEAGRVKWSMQTENQFPPRSFRGCQVALVDAGVRMLHSRASRPMFPAGPARLKEIFEISVGPDGVDDGPCYLCGSKGLAEPTRFCAFCALQHHASCTASLCERIAATETQALIAPEDADKRHAVANFTHEFPWVLNRCCAMCYAVCAPPS